MTAGADATRPSLPRLLELTAKMAGAPVLMLVDLVADRFVTGRPVRISREAPVLILEHQSDTLLPGGGANAVANVKALGGEPLAVGIVGDDDNGRGLLEIFEQRQISTAGIKLRAGYATPTKTRILGGGPQQVKQQIVRIDRGRPLRLAPLDREQLGAAIHSLAGHTEVAVLSDYGYGACAPTLLPEIRRALGEGLVLGDSRSRLREFHGLDGATPNQEEAEAWLEGPLVSRDELRSGGERLLAKLGGSFLLITRGSQGMALFVRRGSGARAALIPVSGTDQVADVTGAGDTVIGTSALALAAGATPLESALLANFAAGVAVMKRGTTTVSPDELRDAIKRGAHLLEQFEWDGS